MAERDVLLRAQSVWKKYCRDLKTSLMYGVADVVRELSASSNEVLDLRPHEFWSLQDISFELHRGETLGLVGANGAGKSTLLKVLNGVVKPTRGRVEINGTMQALIELGGAFSPVLSGRENIFVSAAILGFNKREITPYIDEIIEFAELEEFIEAPVATYSTGMRVRLGFSIAMFIKPDILILDEVLSVGDYAFQTKSLERVAEIREKAGGVIFVSHNVNQLRRLCSKCLLLEHGKAVLYGDAAEVIEEYMLRQVAMTADSKRKRSVGLDDDEAVRLLSWGIEQSGAGTKGTLAMGPFQVWYTIQINEKQSALSLDVSLFNEAMQPIVDFMQPCPELSGVTGVYTISIDYPHIPLSARQYFPYISVVDQNSLRKIVKFLDPVGFSIGGKLTGRGMLAPDVTVNIEPGDYAGVSPRSEEALSR